MRGMLKRTPLTGFLTATEKTGVEELPAAPALLTLSSSEDMNFLRNAPSTLTTLQENVLAICDLDHAQPLTVLRIPAL
jgi:hypothetical protein